MKLESRHYDLLEPMERSMAEGVVYTMHPDDSWHPLDAAGLAFAAHWKELGLLATR